MAGDGKRHGISKAPPGLWRQLGPLAQGKRRAPTPAEAALWERVRNRQLAGLKFRRQVTFGCFVVDFYCPERRLVVEVDGPIHAQQQAEDAARTAYLEGVGLRVLRVANDDVFAHIDDVLERIRATAADLESPGTPKPT